MAGVEDADVTFLAPPPETDLLTAARKLGDSQARTLGMLPYAAWDEYAAQGRILCILDNTALNANQDQSTQLLGYAALVKSRDVVYDVVV